MNPESPHPSPTSFDLQKLRQLQSYVAAGDNYLVRASLASDVPTGEPFFIKNMPQLVTDWFEAFFPHFDLAATEPSEARCITHSDFEWTTRTVATPPNTTLYLQSEPTTHKNEPTKYDGPGQATRLLGSGGYANVFAVEFQGKTHAVKAVKDPAHLHQLAHEYFQITAITQADPNLSDFVPQPSLPGSEIETYLKEGFLFTELRHGSQLSQLIADTDYLPLFRPGTHFPSSRRHHLAISLAEKFQQLHQSGYSHGDIKDDNILVGISPVTKYCTTIHSLDYPRSQQLNPESATTDAVMLRNLIVKLLFGTHPSLEKPNPSPADILNAITSHDISPQSPLTDIADASKINHIIRFLNRQIFH